LRDVGVSEKHGNGQRTMAGILQLRRRVRCKVTTCPCPLALKAYGGSQQHKHVQFIPLPPLEEFSPFPDSLVQEKNYDPTIPFQHFITSLSQTTPTTGLFAAYRSLLDEMHTRDPELSSYNFAMTTRWIFVSPRTKGDYIGEGYTIGVNSAGMIGLLLTKSEEESAFLERMGPLSILATLGKPWPKGTS